MASKYDNKAKQCTFKQNSIRVLRDMFLTDQQNACHLTFIRDI